MNAARLRSDFETFFHIVYLHFLYVLFMILYHLLFCLVMFLSFIQQKIESVVLHFDVNPFPKLTDVSV